ncbi:MAG TPA: protein kinase [Dehalococcoidia bacterium]|nr:protein kinase [Dehalococcoidia bacterium]
MNIEQQPDSSFGPYVLRRRLGGGGFGDVWLAQDQGGEAVALKILRGQYESAEAARFRAEIELLAASASAGSEHIVRVLGGGDEPCPHIVMEYIDGVDLATEVGQRGVLSPEEVLWIAGAIADALMALQRSGIIHRDIKPANVMVHRQGSVKLADFGIAKIVGMETQTGADQTRMSAAYAAPEVWDGKASYLSDHYAFGSLLYYCLTGHPPFSGTYTEVYRQHVSAEPDMSALPAGTPNALRQLIAGCMAKEPEKRPTTAAELLKAIATAQVELAGEATVVVPRFREPKAFGPWVIEARRPGVWSFDCRHRTTGEQAVVELHFTDDLEEVAALRQSATNGAGAAGGGRVLGSSRLILRPGETWRNAPASQFQFWVARAVPAVSPQEETRVLAAQKAIAEAPVLVRPAVVSGPSAVASTPPVAEAVASKNGSQKRRGRLILVAAAATVAAGLAALVFLVVSQGEKAATLQTASQTATASPAVSIRQPAANPSPAIGQSAAFYLDRGARYYDQKQYDLALADYESALKLDPKNARAYSGIGRVLHAQKNEDLALENYNKAIALDPSNASFYTGRGNVHRALGKPDLALADYNKAIALNPKEGEPYNGLGNLHYDAKRFEQAIQEYTRSIDIDPTDSVVYRNRGNAYRAVGKIELARADFEKAKAVAKTPDDVQRSQMLLDGLK